MWRFIRHTLNFLPPGIYWSLSSISDLHQFKSLSRLSSDATSSKKSTHQVSLAKGPLSPLTARAIFSFFFLFRAAPTPYGSYQARGWIGATAADLHHSHSNMGSEPHLQPTPQVTATPDPQPTEWGHRSNPHPHGYWLESFPLCHNGNSIEQFFLPLCDSVTFCLAFELQRGRLLFPSTKLWAFEGL